MKKILSIITALSLVFSAVCLCGCTKEPEDTDESTLFVEEVTTDVSDYSVTISADKTEVAAGDTVTVTLHMKNCKMLASFDFIMSASDNVSVVSFRDKEVGEFMSYPSEEEDGVHFGALVARTADMNDNDYCCVTYKISENAASGDEVSFGAFVKSFFIGKDIDGNETEDVADKIEILPLTFTIK